MSDLLGLAPLIACGFWVACFVGLLVMYWLDERKYGWREDEDPVADDADRLWLIAQARRGEPLR